MAGLETLARTLINPATTEDEVMSVDDEPSNENLEEVLEEVREEAHEILEEVTEDPEPPAA